MKRKNGQNVVGFGMNADFLNFSVLFEKSSVHNAWIKSETSLNREQDAKKIIEVVYELLKSLDFSLTSDITICVTGQMHGVVLWSGEQLVEGR